MKIKKIAALCKQTKAVILFERYSRNGNTVSQQYISDGVAAYIVWGLPQLDTGSVLTIFDVPEKDRDKYVVKTRCIPDGINFDDADENEKPIEVEMLPIVYGGKVLKPLQTRSGLVFIDSKYISPVSDVLDVLMLYERSTPGGATYIVAKAGLLLQAVIIPEDIINQNLVKNLQALTRQCALSLELRKQKQERAKAAEPKQCSLIVDPDTGEIVR